MHPTKRLVDEGTFDSKRGGCLGTKRNVSVDKTTREDLTGNVSGRLEGES